MIIDLLFLFPIISGKQGLEFIELDIQMDSSTDVHIRAVHEGTENKKYIDKGTLIEDNQTTSMEPLSDVAAQGSHNSCSTSSGEPICRICQEGGTYRRKLITPCFCSGSMGYFHAQCLERWLGQSGTNTCEVCNYEFQTIRVDKTFREWLNSSRSERDRRYLWADSTCFLLLTPLGSVSSWLCINAAWQYHSDGDDWTAFGLVMLTTFLTLMYIMWAAITIRYHLRVFKKWRRRNQTVKVVLRNLNDGNRSKQAELQTPLNLSEINCTKSSDPVVI